MKQFHLCVFIHTTRWSSSHVSLHWTHENIFNPSAALRSLKCLNPVALEQLSPLSSSAAGDTTLTAVWRWADSKALLLHGTDRADNMADWPTKSWGRSRLWPSRCHTQLWISRWIHQKTLQSLHLEILYIYFFSFWIILRENEKQQYLTSASQSGLPCYYHRSYGCCRCVGIFRSMVDDKTTLSGCFYFTFFLVHSLSPHATSPAALRTTAEINNIHQAKLACLHGASLTWIQTHAHIKHMFSQKNLSTGAPLLTRSFSPLLIPLTISHLSLSV